MASLIFFALPLDAQQKQIRLRNEAIITLPPGPRAAALPGLAQPPVSGLYLVQFIDRFQPEWGETLRGRGISLLRYVPDDSFVARFDQARLADVRALPFVQWVGEYRPEHKTHASLRDAAGPRPAGAGAPPASREVAILFSPAATAPEVAQLRQLFDRVRQQSNSRFGAVLRGSLPSVRIAELARSPSVLWIEPSAGMKLIDGAATEIVCGTVSTNLTIPQSLGFTGAGVKVAVADSGLHLGTAANMHPDLAGRATNFFYYGGLTDASDEHAHGTHVSGIVAGDGATGEMDENGSLYGLGAAPGAGIVTQRIFDGLGNYEAPPSYEALTRDATRAGAEIGSNSWGDDTQGRYDLSAAEFDALVRDADALTPGDQSYIMEFSAGNAGPGPQTIGSPAVAKNVIATGASQSTRIDSLIYEDGPDAMADFSSRGPCEDGRIKPDLVAPGTWIASLRSPVGDDENSWAPISDKYLYMGGTSQAGPHVSGAAALLVQWFRQRHSLPRPTPALVKATLINSATDLFDDFGTDPAPNMDEGWGRLNMTDLFTGPRQYDFLDQTILLTNAEVYTRRVIVATAGEPLKVTLAYTDVPGLPAAIPALVNDLDLEVIGPSGSIYRGNQFEAGESVANAGSCDPINNVEGVFISEPEPGEYLVQVRARNVVQDARADTAKMDQDFALVSSGDLAPPGLGLVLLDRRAYTAPGTVRVKVIDTDQAGQPSILVEAMSGSDSGREPITLFPDASGIVFTGSIATVVGFGALDGVLQINHGDQIRVEYFDASAGVVRSATAAADLVPPGISGVSTDNSFGQTFIRWTTSEDADAVVWFGASTAALTASATNRVMGTSHEIGLRNLVAGQTYYFVVVSRDAAGNAATNDNGGQFFSFTAVSPATVLLVNAYTYDPDSDFIPVSAYTSAIAQAGVSVDVWETDIMSGSPSLADLMNYKIVMWRINDSFNLIPRDTLSAADQAMIQAYLNSGGAFCMASMEIVSLLLEGSQNFVTNVLHVGSFVRNPGFLTPCPTCDEDAGVPDIEGIPGDVIGHGVYAALDYSLFPSIEFLEIGPDLSDTFTPTTNATPILLDGSSGRPVGMRFPRTGEDSTGRVVFLSFPLESVPESTPPPSSRSALLRNIFQFLAPGLGGFGTIAIDKQVYSVPDLLTVEVADSDLIGQGTTTTVFTSTTDNNGITITLRETVRPGLFRGYLTLATAASAPVAGRLRVNDGDTLLGSYYDESGHLNVTASALVDAVVPVISGLQVAPEYEEAAILWSTSEPADALVQFGESAFLGRTAYVGDFDYAHSNQLSGLGPDRTYYYRVVSRDAAGNVAVDDNGGELYTFRTRRPFDLPFVDDFETGGTNWEVFSDPDTQAHWTLGTPNNGAMSDAHSGVNAWASNITGEQADQIDTFLLSPAINLAGGNKATLRFWHNYDFTEDSDFDIINGGELLLFTNSVDYVSLAEFYDANFGWEEVEIDLSAYVGRVVYLVWHHQLFSLQSAARPGWSVDDIELTITNVPPGLVTVSNNLAQSRFVLSGPLYRTGAGLITQFTNATPGQYIVTWAEVPWYQTPPPQTNILSSGDTLLFTGIYTYADANENGISDAWELNYFNWVDPLRTADTDTDGDGRTDCAEFTAGTDPVSPSSFLECFAPRRIVPAPPEMTWSSVPTRQYRILGSADAATWAPASAWMWGGAGTTAFRLPVPGPGQPYLFKVEVRP